LSPPLLLQPRVGIDVDDLDVEVVAALVLLQGRQELLAEVAVGARKDR